MTLFIFVDMDDSFHFEGEEEYPHSICAGSVCSCKKMHQQRRSGYIDDSFTRCYGGSFRNSGRKPKYKDHHGKGFERRLLIDGECFMKAPPENFRVGKDGEMRAKYKRPTIQLTA